MTPEIAKLAEYAKQWGGALRIVSLDEYTTLLRRESFYEAPFTNSKLGVLWAAKEVIAARGTVFWTEIVHEMGHVFAAKDNPNRSDEYTFFGWEYVLAGKVGDRDQWRKENDLYQVVYRKQDIGFGKLSYTEQTAVLEEAIEDSRKAGLLGEEDTPLAIR